MSDIMKNWISLRDTIKEVEGKNKNEIYNWILLNPKKATILVDFVRFQYRNQHLD